MASSVQEPGVQEPGSHEADFLPLRGVRVLDFTKVLAGPLCTQYLGDLGADVIKVEPCRGGDDTRTWPPFHDGIGTIFLAVNRNKRSLAVDLKTSDGLGVITRLAARCDVVVESYGPGVADRLGIGYQALRQVNPALIYCSISGYGTAGPMKDGKGYDLIAQAFTGMLAMTGEPGGPPARSPFSPVDQGTGLHAVIGIMGALMHRDRGGAGVKLEASLFDTAIGFLGYILQAYWQRGTDPAPPGSGHDSLCPYQAFFTLDRPIILGAANDALWQRFCELVNRPDLAVDPRFLTGAARIANRDATVGTVAEIMLTRSRQDWLAALEGAGIPCSPVHALSEVARHGQTVASGMILEYGLGDGETVNGVATPLRINGARPALRTPPPGLGQHSLTILDELGYSAQDAAALTRRGVVFAESLPAMHNAIAAHAPVPG